jgi:hypothetical protein
MWPVGTTWLVATRDAGTTTNAAFDIAFYT